MVDANALLEMTTADLLELAFTAGHITFSELLDVAVVNATSTEDSRGEVRHILSDGSALIITSNEIVTAY